VLFAFGKRFDGEIKILVGIFAKDLPCLCSHGRCEAGDVGSGVDLCQMNDGGDKISAFEE